jgi:hypothetical protein
MIREAEVEESSVIEIPIEEIRFDETIGQESQVRPTGNKSGHIQDLVASILNYGQQVPLSVERLLDGSFKVANGNGRTAAIKIINEEHRPCAVRAIVVEFANNKERVEYQIFQNEHLPHLRNTFIDRKSALLQLVKVENACGDLGRFETDKERLECIKDYAKELLGDHKDINKLAKAVFNTAANDSRRVHNYTKKQAQQYLNTHRIDHHGYIKGSGDMDSGYGFYFEGRMMDVTKAHAQAVKFRMKHGSAIKELICVAWLEDCIGADPQDIINFRDAVVEEATRFNEYLCMDVFTQIYFLPQIRRNGDGPNDNNDNFIIIDVTNKRK